MARLGVTSAASVFAVMAFVGCAGEDATSLQMRVSALQQEQARRQAELQGVAAQIAAARLELARQQCLASSAAIAAEVTVKAAICLASRSKFAQCEANNHAHTAESGVLGCVAGMGGAVLTGGAALPLTLLGCGGGAALGHASGSECGPDPVCTPDEAILARDALQRRGLAAWPTCQ
jgi:hypothetical protein